MIKYFLQREVTAKEAIPVITFMLASNHETVLLEITEMLLHYLESKVAKLQLTWARVKFLSTPRPKIKLVASAKCASGFPS